jgi:hypothetical protein
MERARIRATVLEAARARSKVWLRPATLAWGVTCVLVVVAVLVASRGRVPGDHRMAAAPIPDASVEAKLVAERVEPPARPQPVASRPVLAHRKPPVPGRPRPTPDADAPTTRIVFTAPEGTRIFWFGAGTPAKEDAT